MPERLKIGTRQSPLAIKQTEMVMEALHVKRPDLDMEVVTISTSGDVDQSGSLADIGGKALFSKEIETALLDERIDIAVHSMKDMETNLPNGLTIAAVLAREDPRDVLIVDKTSAITASTEDGNPLDLLGDGATVATCSPRREAYVKHIRPDLNVIPMRGNLATRLQKLEEGEADATLLAYAGIKRQGLEAEIQERFVMQAFETKHMLPAASQGIIGVECRIDDGHIMSLLSTINHAETFTAMATERSLLNKLNGSCRTAIGVYAHSDDEKLSIEATLYAPDGSLTIADARTGDAINAEAMAHDIAKKLLHDGSDILNGAA